MLKSHVERVHENVKNYSCHLCNVSFFLFFQCIIKINQIFIILQTYYYKLEQYENHMFVKHKQNISNRTVYQCSSCSYSCLSRSRMTNHMKTHLGTQQFRCRICRKGFPTAARLKIHELTHSEVARGIFECRFCKFNSAIRHYVYRHIATLHSHYKYVV